MFYEKWNVLNTFDKAQGYRHYFSWNITQHFCYDYWCSLWRTTYKNNKYMSINDLYLQFNIVIFFWLANTKLEKSWAKEWICVYSWKRKGNEVKKRKESSKSPYLRGKLSLKTFLHEKWLVNIILNVCSSAVWDSLFWLFLRQVLYFPDRWWHATLNLDTSVFISTFLGWTSHSSLSSAVQINLI